MKKGLLLGILAVLLAAFFSASAETVRQHVFYASEHDPFPAGAETLDLYVAPLLGADCMCLICGGETMLVDTGKPSNYAEVRAMLDDLGITSFRYIFNSHPHEDHLGAFPLLVKDYPVGEYLTVFPRDYRRPLSHQKAAVTAADEAGIPVTELHDGDSFTLGGALLTVYQYTKVDDLNQLSGQLLVSFGERRMLLTGDCDGIVGKILSESHDLHAEILKYPHHGVSGVLDEEIENIAPEFAIIPHGYFDTEKAQKTLNRHHIPFAFATWGVIHAATDGQIWIVEQELSEDGINMNEKYGMEPGIWK